MKLDLNEILENAFTEEELQEEGKKIAREAIIKGLEKAFDDVFCRYSSPF